LIAEKLKVMASGKPPWPSIDADEVIPWVETRTKLVLAENQKQALRTAVVANVLVITGGPGIGKTTLVNSLLKIQYSTIAVHDYPKCLDNLGSGVLSSDMGCEVIGLIEPGRPVANGSHDSGRSRRHNRRTIAIDRLIISVDRSGANQCVCLQTLGINSANLFDDDQISIRAIRSVFRQWNNRTRCLVVNMFHQ